MHTYVKFSYWYFSYCSLTISGCKENGDNNDEDCRICSLFCCSVKIVDDIIIYDRIDKLIKNDTSNINLAVLPILKINPKTI